MPMKSKAATAALAMASAATAITAGLSTGPAASYCSTMWHVPERMFLSASMKAADLAKASVRIFLNKE